MPPDSPEVTAHAAVAALYAEQEKLRQREDRLRREARAAERHGPELGL